MCKQSRFFLLNSNGLATEMQNTVGNILQELQYIVTKRGEIKIYSMCNKKELQILILTFHNKILSDFIDPIDIGSYLRRRFRCK